MKRHALIYFGVVPSLLKSKNEMCFVYQSFFYQCLMQNVTHSKYFHFSAPFFPLHFVSWQLIRFFFIFPIQLFTIDENVVDFDDIVEKSLSLCSFYRRIVSTSLLHFSHRIKESSNISVINPKTAVGYSTSNHSYEPKKTSLLHAHDLCDSPKMFLLKKIN